MKLFDKLICVKLSFLEEGQMNNAVCEARLALGLKCLINGFLIRMPVAWKTK